MSIKQINQIELIAAISRELARQGVEAIGCRHLKACIDAANAIIREFEREDVIAPPAAGLAKWLASDDTGMSNKFMACVLAGGPKAPHAYPLDPSDFGRCYRFLLAVPLAKQKLGEMATTGAIWKRYVEHWPEMERLYEEEFPTGNAPKLYALMQKLQRDDTPRHDARPSEVKP